MSTHVGVYVHMSTNMYVPISVLSQALPAVITASSTAVLSTGCICICPQLVSTRTTVAPTTRRPRRVEWRRDAILRAALVLVCVHMSMSYIVSLSLSLSTRIPLDIIAFSDGGHLMYIQF